MKKKAVLLCLSIILLNSCTIRFNIGNSSSNSLTSSHSSDYLSTESSVSIKESSESISVSSSSSVSHSESSSSFSSVSNHSSISSVTNEKEILKNTLFDTLDNWQLFHNEVTSAEVINQGNKRITLRVNNKNASDNWSVQFLQNNISLQMNKTYKVAFEIKSSLERDIQFLIQSSDYSYLPLNETIHLNAEQNYAFSTTIDVNQSASFLYGFMLGKVNGTLIDNHEITISNVSLIGEANNNPDTELNEGKDGTYTSAPQELKNRTLVWNDEFNGTEIDQSKWGYEIGNSGWGNNEYQYYTDRKSNAYCSNGSLKIVARKENYSNSSYTSARLISKDKYEFTYGYVETRLAIPSMSGIWPAFWLLGANINEQPWPYCGEIDVMEAINDESKVYSTLHWNNGSYGTNYSHAEYGNGGVNINDRTQYHIYGFEWTEESIKTYLDGNLSFTMNITGNNGIEAFRKDFYFLFNVAVGGNWPGFSIGNIFPQVMSVDYIRVYQ